MTVMHQLRRHSPKAKCVQMPHLFLLADNMQPSPCAAPCSFEVQSPSRPSHAREIPSRGTAVTRSPSFRSAA